MALNCETVIGLIVSTIVFITGIVALSIALIRHAMCQRKKEIYQIFQMSFKDPKPSQTTAKSLFIATKSYIFNFSPECAPLSDFEAD
eukprot:212283_1